jgi:hypothetical protein
MAPQPEPVYQLDSVRRRLFSPASSTSTPWPPNEPYSSIPTQYPELEVTVRQGRPARGRPASNRAPRRLFRPRSTPVATAEDVSSFSTSPPIPVPAASNSSDNVAGGWYRRPGNFADTFRNMDSSFARSLSIEGVPEERYTSDDEGSGQGSVEREVQPPTSTELADDPSYQSWLRRRNRLASRPNIPFLPRPQPHHPHPHTLASFLTQNLTPLLPGHFSYPVPGSTCSICQDVFHSEHPPILVVGIPGCRGHMFCYQCLRKVISSGMANSNKCPLCRTTWFGISGRQLERMGEMWRALEGMERRAASEEEEVVHGDAVQS